MHLRKHKQIHIPEDPRKTEEILILAPAAGTPFEHLYCEFILPLLQVRGQFKLRRGK